MNCEEFEQILLDSGQRVPGEGWMLRTSKAALVQDHVRSCPACATRMAEITELEQVLDQLRASTRHMEAPASVEIELLDTFRANADRRQAAIRFRFPRRLAWLAIATVALVVSSVLVYSKLRPDSQLTERSNRSGREAGILSASVPAGSSAKTVAIDHSHGLGMANPQTIPKGGFALGHRRMSEASTARGLVQASDALSFNGGGSVVRVVLPVSSLVAMGVPVRPDLSENRVTADVWMDPFGAVVSVRLVPANASAD